MEAIILAGGKGTRLQSVISDCPKILAPIGGKPFIFYVLDFLYKSGCTFCVLATGYMSDMVFSAVGERYRGITIKYSNEMTPLGTGGAIKSALEKCHEDDIFVVNGDTYFDVDLEEMKNHHTEKKSELTVAIKRLADCERYGCVEENGGVITTFLEKGEVTDGFINGGIYLIKRDYLHHKNSQCFSFEKDILEKEKNISAFESDGYFIDIGIGKDYEKACKELCDNISSRKRKAIFLDRDGTINKEKDYVHKEEDFDFIEGTFEAIEIFRKKGYLIIIISNQAGIAKGYYTEADLEKLNAYMENEIIAHGGYVDKTFFCPHHVEGKIPEYAFDCPCRKPKIGLIEKAKEYFLSLGIEIDLENSFFVGDTLNDIATGKNAGVGKTVIVKSGHDCDRKNSGADYIRENLIDFARKEML